VASCSLRSSNYALVLVDGIFLGANEDGNISNDVGCSGSVG